jgi:hypothetical protein
MQHRSRFARQLCVAVDTARYGTLDSVAQYDTQGLLSDVLDEAATATGLDRGAWLKQPQGDGELALLPSDQPEPRVVDDFIRELDAVLRLRNHGRLPAARLRLRVAIDFGVAYEAPFGFAGGAVVATARLLGSDSLHRALAEAGGSHLAVALSSTVYQTVRDRHTSLTPDQFFRAEVKEKEFHGDAWIRVLPQGAPAAEVGGKSARRSSSTDIKKARRSARLAASQPSVRNVFNAPVADAGVIGINLAVGPVDEA